MSGAPLWFEKCIATPDIMQELKPVARILGTQGMMPNKKVGTLVEPSKLKEAIEGFKKFQMQMYNLAADVFL